MSNLVLILSQCDKKITCLRTKQIYYRFHFKGHYRGKKLNEILALEPVDKPFVKDDIYLLWVKESKVFDGRLYVEVIKHKKIIDKPKSYDIL
jgi:hypothetical protein